MPDGWERYYGLDPLDDSDASSDADDDGLENLNEYEIGTNPADVDSDNDGMWDGWEDSYWLDPTDANDAEEDLDGDTYSNVVEFVHDSYPFIPDSIPEPLEIGVPTKVSSIQSAINWSISGDVIKVLEGTYYENIDFCGKSVKVRSGHSHWDWHIPRETVESTIIEASDSNIAVVTFDSGEDANSVLTGFTLTGGNYGISCSSSSGPTITNCIIEDNNSHGIYCASASPEITNNMIKLNAGDGIYIYNVDSAPVIKNNWIYENEDGIEFNDANSASIVRNNTVADNNSAGIHVGSAAEPSISNCIFWGNDDDLYDCSSTYSCIEDANTGTGNINSDPLFVDANNYDYHLDANSPCIDAGDPNGTYTGEMDIDGEIRVQRAVIDMGADETHRVHNTTQDQWYTSVQKAIDDSNDGDLVEVYEGTYYETIDFGGKAITLRSTDPNDSNVVAATIIEASEPNLNVLTFDSGEDSNSVLGGFTITGGYTGIYCSYSSSPTITKCRISSNVYCGIYCSSSSPSVSNCIISDNSDYAVRCVLSSPTITNCTIVNNGKYGVYNSAGPTINCILWGHGDELYNCGSAWCCNQDDDDGVGVIDYYPYFADAANNDFHLLSYSPCIDRGDPSSGYSNEPGGGGGRINLGAYGNTSEAALSCADSDTDGLPDEWEIVVGLDPNDPNDRYGPDYDGDLLSNFEEYHYGTDPYDTESDGDVMPDMWEVVYSLDPADPGDGEEDRDGDSYANVVEYLHGSNPVSFGSKPSPVTLHVPDDVASIQQAIYWSIDGDVIEVAEGTYHESINSYGWHPIIKSSDPNNWDVVSATIIDGGGADAVVTLKAQSGNVILTGFTITGGEYGISLESNCSGLIRRCIIEDCNSHGISAFSTSSFGSWAIRENEIRANRGAGIHCSSVAGPAIENNRIHGNGKGIEIVSGETASVVRNNTIVYNIGGGVEFWSGVAPNINNCILWGNGGNDLEGCSATYCCMEDGGAGVGNIGSDPCFVETAYWDSNGTQGDANDDFWVGGDYHLKSGGWRWDVQGVIWLWDEVTSRCIDAGNPSVHGGEELLTMPGDPNNERGVNLRINMGAYGGTREASMPPHDWSLLGDITNDGTVNFHDFAWQAAEWESGGDEQPGDLDRGGGVHLPDVALLVKDWLRQTTWFELPGADMILGDLDSDGDVDFTDFSIFGAAWLTDAGGLEWNPGCDLGVPADGHINIVDLAVLVENWLEGL
jgi:parallel beta-helix repeat protein